MADDFTYWNIAFDVYEKGVAGWQKSSFHALRWPVWGLCWVIQKVAGLGLGAYLGAGLVYLAAGAVVCFQLGRLVRPFAPMQQLLKSLITELHTAFFKPNGFTKERHRFRRVIDTAMQEVEFQSSQWNSSDGPITF